MPYIGNQPAPQNVTSAEITDGTIVNADINASAAIAASKIAGLATVATSGAYSDVTGKPTLATVATSGAYADVTGTPTLPTDFVSAASGGTFSGDIDVGGELIADSYNETYVALSGTTPAVNCEAGNVFALSTSGNTTFTFTNPPASGTAYGFTIKVTAVGTHTLTWPASVDWAGGSAPDAPASGETNVLVFITYDGGTTWYGFQGGAAMA